ncbi:MAG: phosphoglucosamine mutase [Desulfovibrionaceae bacterium]
MNLFGTDGIRGCVNTFPMTVEMVLRVALATGSFLRDTYTRPLVLIGKDTRLSGYIFESAITAGLCAMGVNVLHVGPMPTPAVAFLTQSMRANLGIVISASHNPYHDNGIKFFDHQGFKLAHSVEENISCHAQEETRWKYPSSHSLGKTSRVNDAAGRYIVHLKHSLPKNIRLDTLTIVLDCANGAAYHLAPLLLKELGATVIPLGIEPNGTNINENCGSLSPINVAQMVVEHKADFGIALDGDADRVTLIDEKGAILDGDHIMAICAKNLLRKNLLTHNTLVATIQSNMALENFMKKHNGTLIRTNVGDRHVVEIMRKNNYIFGGEQSGHIIFSEHSTTGDGMLVALQIAQIMQEDNKKLSELSKMLELYPQKMVNILVKEKIPLENSPEITKGVEKAKKELGNKGRIILRYSGTESLCRLMVEAEDDLLAEKITNEIALCVRKNLSCE